MKKLLFAALLVVSTVAIAHNETGLLDPQQQYIAVGSSENKQMTIYIAVSGNGAPRTVSPGIVLFQEMYVEDVDTDGITKGVKVEMFVLVDCNKQARKMVPVVDQVPGSAIEYQFTGDATQRQEELNKALTTEPWDIIVPGSLSSIISEPVCKHAQNHKS